MKKYFEKKIAFFGKEISIIINSYNKIDHGIYRSVEYIILGGNENFSNIKNLIESKSKKNYLKNLQGEFFIILISKFKFEIISDRFNSIPFFYSLVNKELIISDSLSIFYKKLQTASYNEDVLFEFLYFQKKWDKTVLNNVEKVPHLVF